MSLEMAPFNRLHTISYWSSAVTMAISDIVSKTKWDPGRKSTFLYPPYTQQTPVEKVVNICVPFCSLRQPDARQCK